MGIDASSEQRALEDRWQERQRHWARKLGRLRLGVEPLEEQLARYRRVTWSLTIVSGAMALMFLTLFSAFSRPDIGLMVAGLLFLPIGLGPWLGYWRLERRAAAYQAERAAMDAERKRLTGDDAESRTSANQG
ncbi:MAG: hypothetical protein ACP5XB_09680 [Isosphaeraceae bacterium]